MKTMHFLLAPFIFILLSCGSSSDKTSVRPNVTLPLDVLPQYEDFGASMSADGKRGAFISQRETPHTRLYLYDGDQEAAKQIRFADRLAVSEGEQELVATISPDGNWIAVFRQGISANRIILAHFSGSSFQEISLAASTSVRTLSFSSDSQFLVISERSNLSSTVRVFSFSGDVTAVTTSEVGSFSGEDRPQFLIVGSTLHLLTLGGLSNGSREAVLRSFNGGSQSWSEIDTNLSVTDASSQRPIHLSSAGVFTVKALSASKTKTKLGTDTSVTTGSNAKAGILEEVVQADIFSQQLNFDFTTEAYLIEEALALSSISGADDGSLLLINGLDVYFCQTGSQRLNVLRLIRRSDMSIVPIYVTRIAGLADKSWTGVGSDYCALQDESSEGQREFDAAITHAELVSSQGDQFLILIESQSQGDREIRLLSFTLDWTSKAMSEVVITEISKNSR